MSSDSLLSVWTHHSTQDEIKRFNRMKDMYKPLTDWWKDTLTALTEKGGLKVFFCQHCEYQSSFWCLVWTRLEKGD